MASLHLTDRLRRRLRLDWEPAPIEPPGRLGGWYATFLTSRPQHIVIAVNEASLLVLLVAIAPLPTFRERFRIAAVRRLHAIAASPSAIEAEERALGKLIFRPTQSRSVLGSLNNLAYLARVHLAATPGRDLEELSVFLCRTPMFALSTAWPWEEAALLLSATSSLADNRAPDAT